MKSLNGLADELERDLDRSDFYYDPFERAGDEKCPECNSFRMTKYPRQNGPDDFVYSYMCKDCGYTEEG